MGSLRRLLCSNVLSLNIISFFSTILSSVSAKIVRLFRLTSNKELVLPALILSCSSCIGISSLTLPGSVEQTGVVLWPILLFIAAFMNYFSNKLLAKIAFKLKAKSYSEVCEHILGDLKLVPDCLTLISNFCLILSCNLTWVTFLDDLVFIIFSVRSSKPMLVVYMLLPNLCLLPALLKTSIRDVAIPATMSILAVVFLLLFVISTFSAKIYNYAFSSSEDLLFSYSKIILVDFSMIPQTLCLLLFSFSYQQNIIDVSQDLKSKIYEGNQSTIMDGPDSADRSGADEKRKHSLEEGKTAQDSGGRDEENASDGVSSRKGSIVSQQSLNLNDLESPPQTQKLKNRLMEKIIHTILKMENSFKAFLFFSIGMLGFFSFCQKANLVDANILSLYREQSSLVIYVNLFMAVCVLITAIFVFKPTKDTLSELVRFIKSDIEDEKINKCCTFGLHFFIVLTSICLILEKVSFIKLISIISFYISPLVGIYLPVFMYAKLTGKLQYYIVTAVLIIIAILTIWI